MFYRGEVSSENCPLLLLMGKNSFSFRASANKISLMRILRRNGECCQQVPMNRIDPLLFRCALRGSVQRELPSTITYSQKFCGSAQRKSAHTFRSIFCFFRLCLANCYFAHWCSLFGRGTQKFHPAIFNAMQYCYILIARLVRPQSRLLGCR